VNDVSSDIENNNVKSSERTLVSNDKRNGNLATPTINNQQTRNQTTPSILGFSSVPKNNNSNTGVPP
jgi:hypothetical protein